jgi:molybdate transport system permease protein
LKLLDSDRISDGIVTLFLGGTCLLFILFISLPIIAIFLNLSLERVVFELESSQVISALTVGLSTSVLSTTLSLIFGVPTAYLLATRKFPGKSIIETVLDLPMVLPPAVAGIALLLAFAPRGILGPTLRELGIILPGSILAVVLSQFFVASPFILRSSKVAFESVQRNIIDSARILSPSRIRVFFTITLALSTHGVVSGIVMTWARSMGEFGATLMFAGNLPSVTQTMPLAI